MASAALFVLDGSGLEGGVYPLLSGPTIVDHCEAAEWRRVTFTVSPVDGAWLVRGSDTRGTYELTVRAGDTFRVRYVGFRLLVADDIDRAISDELYLKSVIDPLTTTFNRRFLRAHAGRLQPPTALLLIDLDHFKRINDERGMHAGDAVLAATAARLLELVRWPELVVRYGGEEFAVIFRGITHDEARRRAEEIRQAVARPLERIDDDDPAPVISTISIGLTMFNTGEDALADTMRRADENLFLAKQQGRNRVIG